MLRVKVSYEGAGVTLSCDFFSNDLHVHFRKFTFGAQNVFVDVPVQDFSEFLLTEISVDNVVCVVFTSGFLESCLRGLLAAKPLEDILSIGA